MRLKGPSWIVAKWCRRRVRGRLEAGVLPPASGRTWLRRARGDHRCVCCRWRIRRGHRECEGLDRAGYYAHVHCFKVWVEESRYIGPREAVTPRRARARLVDAV